MIQQLQQFLAMLKFKLEAHKSTSTHTMQATKIIINNVLCLELWIPKRQWRNPTKLFFSSASWEYALQTTAVAAWQNGFPVGLVQLQWGRMVRYCNEFKQFPKGFLSCLRGNISPCATNLPEAFPEDQDISLCDLSLAHMPPLLRHHILLN